MRHQAIVFWVVVGMVLGAALAAGAFWFAHRGTTVLTTREALTLEQGIVLPQGTKLVWESSFTEGFEQLTLSVNVQSSDVPHLFVRQDERRAFLRIPYWVR